MAGSGATMPFKTCAFATSQFTMTLPALPLTLDPTGTDPAGLKRLESHQMSWGIDGEIATNRPATTKSNPANRTSDLDQLSEHRLFAEEMATNIRA